MIWDSFFKELEGTPAGQAVNNIQNELTKAKDYIDNPQKIVEKAASEAGKAVGNLSVSKATTTTGGGAIENAQAKLSEPFMQTGLNNGQVLMIAAALVVVVVLVKK